MLTTPIKISEPILEFCKEIEPTTKPVFLKLFPVEGYICGECYGNVERHIEKNGGSTQYGWIIWEIPNILLDAEFHAVWVSNEGEYVDVTPKEDGEENILFLPDSKRIFDGELKDNIRKKLIDNVANRVTIKYAEKKFEIRKKYYRGNPNFGIPLFEEINLRKYAQSIIRTETRKGAMERIPSGISRNKLCLCGSGKKYKMCCEIIN